MKSILLEFSSLVFIALLSFSLNLNAQEFQGQAIYFSKAKMELGSFGARMSEVTIVLESAEKGGSLVTVDIANRYNCGVLPFQIGQQIAKATKF
jgi:hypothetical protein